VPLSRIQIEILRLPASHRDPESCVAGATPLNRAASRYSGDIESGEIPLIRQAALVEAEAFVAKMPTDKAGLFFDSGQWPSSAEITSAMLEKYKIY
jgi:hypothetical protein